MPSYHIIWLDCECAEIGEDAVNKQNIEEARRMIARRIYQSPHLLPKDTVGFYINWFSETDKIKETGNI
jgi:hypothetical protein